MKSSESPTTQSSALSTEHWQPEMKITRGYESELKRILQHHYAPEPFQSTIFDPREQYRSEPDTEFE